MVLFATSNSAPDDLYRAGLQRSRFLPAIALLHEHCQVMHLKVMKDYRLQTLLASGVYFSPISALSDSAMRQCFLTLSSHRGQCDASIEICGRLISVRGYSPEVVWFDFKDLCSLGRSQQDYLALADTVHTVLLSNVPVIPAEDSDIILYFIYLVDVLYDAKVKVIIEAAAPIQELYPQGSQWQHFQRTQSRLHEMQSERYLHASISSGTEPR